MSTEAHVEVEPTKVPLSQIRCNGGTQSRAQMSADRIETLSEHTADLPPLVVFDDGETLWLADGFHRRAAFERAGAEYAPCEVRNGTLDEARLYAAKANSQHDASGSPMTNKDKRRCVEMVLAVCPDWSDRRIAKHVGVAGTTVARVKAEVQQCCTCPAKPRKCKGQDGKSYPATATKVATVVDLPTEDDNQEETMVACETEPDSGPVYKDHYSRSASEAEEFDRRVKSLTEVGKTPSEIAEEIGCHRTTVYHAKKRLGLVDGGSSPVDVVEHTSENLIALLGSCAERGVLEHEHAAQLDKIRLSVRRAFMAAIEAAKETQELERSA